MIWPIDYRKKINLKRLYTLVELWVNRYRLSNKENQLKNRLCKVLHNQTYKPISVQLAQVDVALIYLRILLGSLKVI